MLVPGAGFEPATSRSPILHILTLTYIANDYESGAQTRLGYPGNFFTTPVHLSILFALPKKHYLLSFSQTYSKPSSSRDLISSGLLATFTVNSSLYSPNIVLSTVM